MSNKNRGFMALLLAAMLVVGAVAVSCAQATPTAAPAAPTATAAKAATAAPTAAANTALGHPLLTNEQLSDIQPGLGTVMVEYGTRFANLWFAAQAGNWEMARYQVLEMTEIQEVAEMTRPKRADALKAFEKGFLDKLDEAVKAKDLAAFTTAYDSAIVGCNGCHTGQTSADFPGGYKFVKIQRPTAPVFPGVDWKGQ